ncbi:MAG: hypothetical protein SGBAC_012049 [Bacillariaceae sp.]
MMPHNEPPSASTRNAIIELTSLDQYTDLRNHRMRFEDAFDINAERVNKTNNQDIIFGRGKSLQDFPGNQRMRQITSKYKNLYRTLPRSQKRPLVESVYKEIVCNGARFLTKAPKETFYLLVDVEVALQKISNSLRCMKEYKRQPMATRECQGSSEQQDPICSTSAVASSSIVKEAAHKLRCKIDDPRAPPRKSWNSPKSSPLPFPNPDGIPGSKNLDVLSTTQHFDQTGRLQLLMDAHMMPSMAIGRGVNVPVLQLPSPQSASPNLGSQSLQDFQNGI